MSAVTGPPEKMAANREELTPMMSQYFELCAAYEDSLVLFQVGDFYETFCEAAEEAARVLEITLTAREDSSGSYPMAGIPIDSAASYIETLLDAGYRVAVADQVQDPAETTGVVDRAVTRVVTPGTVVEDELLAPENNYVASVVRDRAASGEPRYAVAFVDVSTGEFLVTSGLRGTVADELERFAPAELLLGPSVADDAFDQDCMVTRHETDAYEREHARDRVERHVDGAAGQLESDAELRASGALLAYAAYTQGDDDAALAYISRLHRYDPREHLRLDPVALRSLEVFENREGTEGDTLVDVLDETACALGRRRLTDWLRRPLVDPAAIEARQDAVAELRDAAVVREEIHDLLAAVYDIERLVARVSRERANARDLRSLAATLAVVPDVKAALADAESDHLTRLHGALDACADVRDLIDGAIVDDPPIEITEGGVVREGFDEELDDLRATEREGREWVANLEARERDRTGIDSLSVGYNQVHGYYIEVTNPNLDRVPDDYTRRQTLKNSERFYTPELKRREDEILGAQERADRREHELFVEVRAAVADETERLQTLADALARLDVLCTFAAVASEYDYVRPEMGGDGIVVEGGRHPVVERTREAFVPNDADLTDDRIAVITGPNMSGKSTYMRQVALIVLLAHAGSFVPAERARVPIVDRVFTRVGASDDIAGGQSTFMREMSELSTILDHATDRSLVLLDEVGRGTSTADGLSIARAVTEHVAREVGAMTLFATHYHRLTAVAADLDGVRNLHFDAERDGGDVTFSHDVRPGPTASSYGVDVARLAGVPDPVVERARELLDDGGQPVDAPGGARDAGDSETGQSGAGAATPDLPDGLGRELRELNLASMTPLEALTYLDDVQRRLTDDD
ncbi:MAG: DNA mismatch repair protein MutS [Haloarculaceae archaeon]